MLAQVERNEVKRCLRFLESQNKLMETQIRGIGKHLLSLSSETLERSNIDGAETALRILLSKHTELAARLIKFGIDDIPTRPLYLFEETLTESIITRIS